MKQSFHTRAWLCALFFISFIYHGQAQAPDNSGARVPAEDYQLSIDIDQNSTKTQGIRVYDNVTNASPSLNAFNNLDQRITMGVNGSTHPSAPSDGFIWLYDGNDIRFGTNSQERFRVKGNGQIVIGAEDPYFYTKLDVFSRDSRFTVFDLDGGGNLILAAEFRGLNDYNPQVRYVGRTEKFFDVGLAADGSYVIENTDAPVITIDTFSNVSIDATASVDVLGINTDNPNTAVLHLKTNGTNYNNAFRMETSTASFEDWYTFMNTDDDYCIRNDGAAPYFKIEKNTGNVSITGNISKGGGTFKIDHPMDPENKYLYHSFVESPDMMNVYNGNIVTNEMGEAIVELPDYFQALNSDFRYQLTAIGTFAQVIVKEKIENGKFVVASSEPNVEISWQVTGIRKDPYAIANRVVPEVEKADANKGKYLHPAAYGQPESMGEGASPEIESKK